MPLSGAGPKVLLSELNRVVGVAGNVMDFGVGTGAAARIRFGVGGGTAGASYGFDFNGVAIVAGLNRPINLMTSGTGIVLPSQAIVNKRLVLAYSAALAVNAALANSLEVTPTDGVAFAIGAPTNPNAGQELEFTVTNTFGVLGVLTWNAIYKMAAWVQPANGFSRSIRFRYNGAAWVERSRTPADIPN